MKQLIKNYVSNLTKEQVADFSKSKNIFLNDNELDFVYTYIKNNYDKLITNPNIDLSKYKQYLSEENYNKIVNLVNEYKKKYAGLI